MNIMKLKRILSFFYFYFSQSFSFSYFVKRATLSVKLIHLSLATNVYTYNQYARIRSMGADFDWCRVWRVPSCPAFCPICWIYCMHLMKTFFFWWNCYLEQGWHEIIQKQNHKSTCVLLYATCRCQVVTEDFTSYIHILLQ